MKYVSLSILALLLVAFNCIAQDSTDDIVMAPYFTSIEQARAGEVDGRYILVDFYSDW